MWTHFSHALIADILFSSPGLLPLIPFAVLGAVIPDTDILFSVISDRNPSLYLFTHGGIAHSIAGAFVLSLLAYGSVIMLVSAGIIPVSAVTAAGVYGFAAVLAGALLHIVIDVSAIPGIPLLAPFSDRKYTLGILPGPSLLLAVAAFGVVVVTMLSLLSFSSAMVLYGITVRPLYRRKSRDIPYRGSNASRQEDPVHQPVPLACDTGR